MLYLEKEKNRLISTTSQLQDELYKCQESGKNDQERLLEDFHKKFDDVTVKNLSLTQVTNIYISLLKET